MKDLQKQVVTNNITPPNENLEKLKKNFPHCFDKNGNFDFKKFKRELTKSGVDFSKESYGMDWLGKSYARVLATDAATTLLKEDEKWNQKQENKNSQNLLIKGDNLEVLKHLVHAYTEEIKMIYIDPPYNTGNDGFVYQDDRKFTVEELSKLAGIDEEKAKRILEFVNSKSNSHSAWLTFMYPRLYIARQLLRDDGVIFVSIDDNEVAQLRILMDDIFGEENFVATIIWEKTYAPKNNAKHFSENHDYIIVYAKNIEKLVCNGLERSKEANNRYQNPDNDPRGVWKASDLSVIGENRKNIYEITTPSGKKVLPPKGRSWAFPKEKFEELVKDNRIWFGKDGNNVPSLKRFLSEVKNIITPQTIWKYDEVGHTQRATQNLKLLFGGEAYFDFPKPVPLIVKMVQLYTNIDSKDLILDFFAGSGTTGHAVMQLNAEDGGNRKYILVQLPEPIDPKKNKTAYDFVKNELGVEKPTVFEICKERLVRAAKKIKKEVINKKIEEKQKEIKELQSKLDLEGNKEKIKELEKEIEQLQNQDLGFKIFETVSLNEGVWKDYVFKAEEFDPQIKLFDEAKLTEKDIKALLTTWKTYDGIPLTKSLKEINLNGYKAFYLDTKLYLMHKGFKTENLKKLLEEIDSNPDLNPATIIAFGYNFESKILREISENVKNYANKKQIDIDFVIRY